jgi:hypothetical protein
MSYIVWLVDKIAELRCARYLAQQRRYNASEKGRARNARYDFSEKGRTRHSWYNTTTNGRIRQERYRQHVNLMWTVDGHRNRRSNQPERRSRIALVRDAR